MILKISTFRKWTQQWPPAQMWGFRCNPDTRLDKTISLASFVCDFVFLQHGRQNLCFLNINRLIKNHLHVFIQVRSTFALRKCLHSLRHWSISVRIRAFTFKPQFELIGASVAQSSKRPPPLYQTSVHTWEEFVHALPKVVVFLQVVRFPSTGRNLTGWIRRR